MGENNDEDAEKFAILYFLHSVVLSNIDTVVIPRLHFDLVDSGRYKDFPWDSLSFEDLARSLNNRLKAGGKFYLIQGMLLAIQVWLYECWSNVPPKIALKKINEHSKKKQKVDSSTPVAKKPAGKKKVNIDDAHTQTRTPPHRAAKAAVMKTPVFKPISSSKTKKEKKTARVIFPQVQSKADSYVEEVAASKRKSHVEKEKFISKKIFDAFREEVRQDFKGVCEEFTRIRQLVKKKFKKMVKAIEHSKQQHEDTEVEAQQMDYAGVETSPQQFSPIVDQNLDENQDGTKGCTNLHPDKTNIQIDSQYLIPDELLQSINLDYNLSEKIVHHDDRITDEKLDDKNLSDSQFTIPDELLRSLNAYRRESTTRYPLATSEEEQIDEHFNDKKSESVVQEHCRKNKENIDLSSKADMHREVDVGMEEQIMTTPKTQDLTIDEKRDETVLPDS
ncbi:hypothetical protein FXO38_33506 [Capsicum annuum]|nr:hypothetical protein FXO38_33506 [Capsicum annuum]